MAEVSKLIAGPRVLLIGPNHPSASGGGGVQVKHLMVALAAFAGSDSLSADPVAEVDPYRYVVSVGCAEADGQTVRYVWHPGALPKTEGDRVFKVLAGSEVEECLSELARTESGLFERLAKLGPKSGDEVITATMEEAAEVWSRHGVYEAVREVAATGETGPRVRELLKQCDEMRLGREQAAGAQRP